MAEEPILSENEELSTGKSGTELSLKQECGLSLNRPNCFCDVDKSKWPNCMNPHDMKGLGKIKVGSGWEDLTLLINRMLSGGGGKKIDLYFRSYEIVKRKPDPKSGPKDGKVMYVEEIQLDLGDRKTSSYDKKENEDSKSDKHDKKEKIEWDDLDKNILEDPTEFEEIIDIIEKLERSKKLEGAVIRGYTDLKGNANSNLNLSKIRAEWVRKNLRERFGLLSNITIPIVACGEHFAQRTSKNEKAPEDCIDNRIVTIELKLKEQSTEESINEDANIKVMTPGDYDIYEFDDIVEVSWESKSKIDGKVIIQIYRLNASSSLEFYRTIGETEIIANQYKWTIPKRFLVSDETIDNLKYLDKIPEDILKELKKIINKESSDEEQFETLLNDTFGNKIVNARKYYHRIISQSINPVAPVVESKYRIKVTSFENTSIYGYSGTFLIDDSSMEKYHMISYHDYYETREPTLKEPIYISPFRRLTPDKRSGTKEKSHDIFEEPWEQIYKEGKFRRVKALRTSELLPGVENAMNRGRVKDSEKLVSDNGLLVDKKRSEEVIELGKKYIKLFENVLGTTNKEWYENKCKNKIEAIFKPRFYETEKSFVSHDDDNLDLPWSSNYYKYVHNDTHHELPVPTYYSTPKKTRDKINIHGREYDHSVISSYEEYFQEKDLQVEFISAFLDKEWQKMINDRMNSAKEITVGALKIHFKSGEPKKI